MKRIRLIKALVGSILILAMFLGITGVAYGHIVTTSIDTGAVVWDVRARVWAQYFPMTERWRGGHSMNSNYQNSGKSYPIKYMALRATLWSSKTGKDGSWTSRDDVRNPKNGYHENISRVTADTASETVLAPLLDYYGRAYTMGYFQSSLGTIWAMHRPWGGNNTKPLVRDKHDKHGGPGK